jgi:hypothetical protein
MDEACRLGRAIILRSACADNLEHAVEKFLNCNSNCGLLRAGYRPRNDTGEKHNGQNMDKHKKAPSWDKLQNSFLDKIAIPRLGTDRNEKIVRGPSGVEGSMTQ